MSAKQQLQAYANARKSNLPFNLDKFNESTNKEEFLSTALNEALKVNLLDKQQQYITKEQTKQLFFSLGFLPNEYQLTEAFVFSCFDKNYVPLLKQFTSKTSLPPISQEEEVQGKVKSGFHLSDFQIWILKNLSKLSFNPQQAKIQLQQMKSQLPQVLAPSRRRAMSEKKKSPKEKLQEKLLPLVKLFDQMDILRQENGVEPINMIRRVDDEIQGDDGEDKEFSQLRSIKYDPEMSQLNKDITKMRNKAEDLLKEFIRAAKHDKFIMNKLEEGIMKFQRERIILNDKQGRLGAMKAQERLKETRMNQELKLLQDLERSMAHEENTVKTAYLYNLLTKRINPYRVKIEKRTKPENQSRINYLMTTKLQ